jgi:hypothetical protein
MRLLIDSDGWIVGIVDVIGLLKVFHHSPLCLKSCYSVEALGFLSSVKAEIGGENYHRKKIFYE